MKRKDINYSTNLVKALNEKPKKCPAIVAINLETVQRFGNCSPHVMVATNALQGKDHLREQWFINCKNSCRDDDDEPGIF